jgi:hypothetical protein
LRATSGHLGGTFKDSLRAPVHRWFNYPAGFSNTFVYELLDEFAIGPKSGPIVDPFAGAATTLLASREKGFSSLGVEAHPLIHQIGLAKLDWELAECSDVRGTIRDALELLDAQPRQDQDYPELVKRCFPSDVLADLTRARVATQLAAAGDKRLWRFLIVGLLAVLRQVATVGTATWQYVLPSRSRRGGPPVREALGRQWAMMASDLEWALARCAKPLAQAHLMAADARTTTLLGTDAAACVTSPPYLNNYDYADSTRLELYFLGQAATWRDITQNVRTRLVRSATTQISRRTYGDGIALADELPAGMRGELRERIAAMSEQRASHGGKKDYDVVCAEYFNDMLPVLRHLAQALQPGAPALWIVGDSAPYGVHVPTERFLGELAISVGFSSYAAHELRRRNIKWRNRKHRVPLSESLLVLMR